ncbi:MAG: Tim44 domain-containing protein [Myxococcales bacterium]|nr:Tim44 domain-containing protein [Myxococcales bacterium]
MRASRFGWLLAALVFAGGAEARPGGGGSYKSSSGGGSYKSSSGGGSYKSSSGGGSSYKSSSGGGSYKSSSGGGYKSSSGGGSYKSSGGSGGSGYSGSGGGSGYSGSGGGYTGSGGSYTGSGGGGTVSYGSQPPSDRAAFVIFFILVPLMCFGLVLYFRYRRDPLDLEFEAEPVAQPLPPSPSRPELRHELEALRERDPDFSVIVFEDFLYALFAAAHEARVANLRLRALSPWLGDDALWGLKSRGHAVDEVRSIVVGALHYRALKLTEQTVSVRVTFEANYEEVSKGRAQAVYVVEQWRLVRNRDAKSRAPMATRTWDCPACGGALGGMTQRTCRHCGKVLERGEFDWTVVRIDEEARETRTPMLEGTTEEQGTDLPTIVDPRAKSAFEALTAKDPAFDWDGFVARVKLVFAELQIAWSNRDADAMRPYLTDNLWQMQKYWVETYRRSGYRNVTAEGFVHEVEGARLTSDRWFDAITVRVRASSYDYTERVTDREVIGGSKSTRRAYTEYWTFIRGATTRGPSKATKECPKCGAALKIDQAGDCTYCRAHVISGDFDWVLSRIEQDESYAG